MYVEHCLFSVSCYLISSVSCGELISWEVGSPPVLFILKWSPSLLSENLSRVADVCTLLHVCVRVCVCASFFELCHSCPGLENSSCYSPCARPEPDPPRLSSVCFLRLRAS